LVITVTSGTLFINVDSEHYKSFKTWSSVMW